MGGERGCASTRARSEPVRVELAAKVLDTTAGELAAAGLVARVSSWAAVRTIEVEPIPIDPDITLDDGISVALAPGDDAATVLRELLARALAVRLAEPPRAIFELHVARERWPILLEDFEAELCIDCVDVRVSGTSVGGLGELVLERVHGPAASFAALGHALAELPDVQPAGRDDRRAGARARRPARGGVAGQAARSPSPTRRSAKRRASCWHRCGPGARARAGRARGTRSGAGAQDARRDAAVANRTAGVRRRVRGRAARTSGATSCAGSADCSATCATSTCIGSRYPSGGSASPRRQPRAGRSSIDGSRRAACSPTRSSSKRSTGRVGTRSIDSRRRASLRARCRPRRSRHAMPRLVSEQVRRCRSAYSRLRERGTVELAHRLRIRIKNLRYTLEFLRETAPERFPEHARALAEAQEELGRLQDAVQTGRLARDLALAEPEHSIVRHALGALVGFGAASEHAARSIAMEAADAADLDTRLRELDLDD